MPTTALSCTPSPPRNLHPYPALPPQYTVELTLEEIFHGCLKKVTHKRKVRLRGVWGGKSFFCLTSPAPPGFALPFFLGSASLGVEPGVLG